MLCHKSSGLPACQTDRLSEVSMCVSKCVGSKHSYFKPKAGTWFINLKNLTGCVELSNTWKCFLFYVAVICWHTGRTRQRKIQLSSTTMGWLAGLCCCTQHMVLCHYTVCWPTSSCSRSVWSTSCANSRLWSSSASEKYFVCLCEAASIVYEDCVSTLNFYILFL